MGSIHFKKEGRKGHSVLAFVQSDPDGGAGRSGGFEISTPANLQFNSDFGIGMRNDLFRVGSGNDLDTYWINKGK